MKFVLTTYQHVLLEIRRRIETIMVLPGSSQHCQVSVAKHFCQLPFTLLPNEEDRGDQVSFR
jgi:hypothetical protein